jgi:hypothetical protein
VTGQLVGGGDLQAGGVDQDEVVAVPIRVAVKAIARGARKIFDDRAALADQAVEQGRLADVRTADNGDNWLGDGDLTPSQSLGSTGVHFRRKAGMNRPKADFLLHGCPREAIVSLSGQAVRGR